jgi:hypothetical protein
MNRNANLFIVVSGLIAIVTVALLKLPNVLDGLSFYRELLKQGESAYYSYGKISKFNGIDAINAAYANEFVKPLKSLVTDALISGVFVSGLSFGFVGFFLRR